MALQLSAFLVAFLYLESVQASTPSIDRCPGTIFRRVASSDSTVSVTWDDPDCGPNAQSTHVKGSTFGPGVHNVIYWFSGDSQSNANHRCCSFDVFVAGPDFDLCSQNVCDDTDVCVPEVDHYYCYPGNSNIRIYNCSTAVILRTQGDDSVTADFVKPTAFDHYGRQLPLSYVPNVLPGATLSPNEPYINTYTFSDRGRQASCTFNIIVVDVSGPGFKNCPQDIHVTSKKPFVNVDWLEPQLQTNEDRNQISLTQTHSPGQLFSVPSSTTVTYTFTDTSDGSVMPTSCSFVVTTGSPQSIEGEVSGGPSSQEFVRFAQQSQNIFMWPRPYFDRLNSDSETPLIVTPSRVQPDIRSGATNEIVYPKGFYPVTYNFADVFGNNLGTNEFVVVYFDGSDKVQFECPPSELTDIEVSSELPTEASWVLPNASRGEESDLVWREDPPYQPNHSLFNVTTTSFTYMFYSPGSSTPFPCPYSVTVTDTIPPRITSCPSNITVEAPNGTLVTVHFPDTANATDGSGIVHKIFSSPSPVTLTAGDSSTIHSFFLDDASNFAACYFTISVLIQAPVTSIVPSQPVVIMNCLDRVLNVSSNSTTLSPNLLPRAAVDQAGTQQATLSQYSFLVNTRTSVTATFPGLTESCDFIVLVLDNTPPVVHDCSQEIILSAPIGVNYLPVNWTEPNSVDSLEGGDLVARSHAPGNIFPVGETSTVFYVFQDEAGVQTNCFVNITLKSAPLKQCPPTEPPGPQRNNDPGKGAFSLTSETIVVVVVTAVATFVFSLAIFLMSLCCCTCCCVVDSETGNREEKTSRQCSCSRSNGERTRLYVKVGSKRLPIYGPVTSVPNTNTRSAREIDDWAIYDHGETAGVTENHSPFQNELKETPKLITVSESMLSHGNSRGNRTNIELQTTVTPSRQTSFDKNNSGGSFIDEDRNNRVYDYDDPPESNKIPPPRPPKPESQRYSKTILGRSAFSEMQAELQQVKEEQVWSGLGDESGELYGFDNPAEWGV